MTTQSLQNLPSDLDPRGLPNHVAVIMDGNGRWAQRQGLPRIEEILEARKKKLTIKRIPTSKIRKEIIKES